MSQLDINKAALEEKYIGQVDRLRNNISITQNYLNSYAQNSVTYQSEIERLVTLQYEKGEIDILDFNRIHQRTLDDKNRNLEQINLFNQAFLQLSYLTQKSN